MTSADIAALQKIELEILDEILRLCDKHQLKLVLIGGSCIGAVRHQGFIPWDDDIDLGMPRKDYEKLREICKTELSSSFVFQDFETEPQCGLIFGKIRRKDTTLSENYSYHVPMHQGVWVDIFPYDYVSDDVDTQAKDRKRMALWQNVYIIRCGYAFPENRPKWMKLPYYVAKGLSHMFPLRFYIRHIKNIMFQYNDAQTNTIYLYGGVYKEKDVLPARVLDSLKTVSFENRKVHIISEYDMYLKALYGNYMQLPPEEKRVAGGHTIHEFRDDRRSKQV